MTMISRFVSFLILILAAAGTAGAAESILLDTTPPFEWPLETAGGIQEEESRQDIGTLSEIGEMIRQAWLSEDKIPFADGSAYTEAGNRHLVKTRELFNDIEETLELETASALEKRIIQLESEPVPGDSLSAEKRYTQIRALKRAVVFANPLYQTGPLLFVKRVPTEYSHLVMQYFGWRARPGGGIFILEQPGESLKCRDLFDGKLAAGSVLEPRISYDAKKIVFSWVDLSAGTVFDANKIDFTDPDEAFYHIWSADIDGTNLQQLTSGSFDDITPVFLPDGRIAFSSTRRKGYARCFWWKFGERWHVYTIHSMNADGSGMKTLSWHDTNEWFPEVSHNGNLIYARWDYIDRDAVTHQNLWSMRLDGTNPAALWGNATPNPNCTFQAKPIPNSGKYIFTASAHHSLTGGSIVLLDPAEGKDGQNALTRITPEIPFPESEGFEVKEYYDSPYPLSEKYYLVSYSPYALKWEWEDPQPKNALGLYTLDIFGNRELLYRDPDIGATNPTPISVREKPSVPASQLPENPPPYGEMSIFDIYEGLGTDVRRGSIKEVRIVQLFPKTTRDSDLPPIGMAREENGRAILGTVPVEEDGSAYFRVPACTPFYLQALDENGFAYQTMRSLTYLQPGETISCVGCHENRESSTYLTPDTLNTGGKRPLAMERKASIPDPGKLGGRPFAYPHDIQPIFDAKCISCHNENQKEGGYDLTGVPEGQDQKAFTRSYIALMGDRDFWGEGTNPQNAAEALVPRFGGRNIIQVTEPGGMYGALGSRLLKMLIAGHHDVELTDEEIRTLAAWIDLNGIFSGTGELGAQQTVREGGIPPMPEIQ